jgi:16S rRNA (guanine966-N2)-methyltransferase
MRVISGKFRGRRLKGPEGLELRPTGDRLKETLFNILGQKVRGAVVLDVFGGSGAIGLEALSRGASEVAFIENSESAQRLIHHNLKLCGIEGGCRILKEDVFAALRFLARKGFKADIVFFDPPYDFRPYDDLLDITFLRGLLQPSGIAVIEHHRKAPLADSGKGFERTRVVQQGDHWLSFFESRSQDSGVRSQE